MDKKNKFDYIQLDTAFDPDMYVIVQYYLEFEGNLEKCVRALAAESSIGTWTRIHTVNQKVFTKFAAKVFVIEKHSENSATIEVAYPIALFETDNIPQLLSCIGGSAFGIRNITNLRVRDVHLPEIFIKANNGPAYGIKGIHDMLKTYDRPITCTVLKPKVGLSPQEYADLAYKAWNNGIDIIKDDEHLVDQESNPFYERVSRMIDVRRKVEEETGKKKVYAPNISARMSEMYARAKFVREMGGRAVLVDMITVGYSGLQFIRDQAMNIIIIGHRAMHSAFTHTYRHGIAMIVLAKLARLAGVDMLHIGTVVGGPEGTEKEAAYIHQSLTSDWSSLRTTMPILSGGLHPADIPGLITSLGKDIAVSMGGAVSGHPEGVSAGSKALRQAVDAALKGVSINKYAAKHQELSRALEKWSINEKKKKTALVTYKYGLALQDTKALQKSD